MIGERIKELRIINNMTQKDLADKIYVTYQCISRWENSDSDPSIECLISLADVFNVSIDYLVGREKE